MTKLRAKVVVEGDLKVLTGMHVGSAGIGTQIGGIDNPVVRDPVGGYPYIPGSSLKGKLRSLLEAAEGLEPNRPGGSGTYRHECDDRQQAIGCPVCRPFGSTGRNGGKNHPARLMVSDLLITDDSAKELDMVDTGLMHTEWKFENTLDRITSAANPRQIERVPAGSVFGLRLVYDDRDDSADGRDPDGDARTDLSNLARAMRLLRDDALGGHGSRGYGRVDFENLRRSHRSAEQYATDEEFEDRELGDIAELVGIYEGASTT